MFNYSDQPLGVFFWGGGRVGDVIFFYIPFPFSLIPESPVTEARLACDIFVG